MQMSTAGLLPADNGRTTPARGCRTPNAMRSRKPTVRFADVSSDLLTHGYGVRFRAGGSSMTPAIDDGDVITVRPLGRTSLIPGRVIVYRDRDRVIAHRIVGIAANHPSASHLVVRGDAAPDCDPPVAPSQVLGEVVGVRPRRFRALRAVIRSVVASGLPHLPTPPRLTAGGVSSRLTCRRLM